MLDVNQKVKTSYCIPLWLRDEQIKLAIVGHSIIQACIATQAQMAINAFGEQFQFSLEFL